jgi:hypothetical protein
MAKKPKKVRRRDDLLDRDGVRACLKVLKESAKDPRSLDVLFDLLERAANPGEDLAWLAAYDLDPEVSSVAVLALFFALEDERVPPDVCEGIQDTAALVLLRALKSPSVPDERKYSLGPLYGLCAEEVPPEEYRSFFKDFGMVSRRMMTDLIDHLSEDPSGVYRVLIEMDDAIDEDAPVDERFGTAMRVALLMRDTRPRAASALIAANVVLGYDEGVPDDELERALQEVETVACPEAVWFLDEMGRWPGLGPLHGQAERLANKLKLGGLNPHYELRSTFAHGLITGPDGAGSSHITLFFRPPEGAMDALMFLLNDTVGIKDVICICREGDHVAQRVGLLANEIALAPCSLERAREIIADRWAFHEQADVPLPPYLFICRPYFGEDPITPQSRMPDLAVYDLAAEQRGPDLFRHSERLLRSPLFGMFMFTSDQAYDFLAPMKSKRSNRLTKPQFETFVREIAAQDKPILLSRLAATLEVEAWAGRAGKPLNKIAARTWLGLREEVLPFHEVPYVRRLAEASVSMVIENLRLGFTNQADAHEAVLAMDEILGDPFAPEE